MLSSRQVYINLTFIILADAFIQTDSQERD